MSQLFEFKSYRDYLAEKFSARGSRSPLAKALNCQTSFLSLVITKRAHFTLEHSYLLCRYLGMTSLETDFFILLVQLEKAGSRDLEEYFQGKINQILEERESISSRIDVKDDLSVEDATRYYSSWHYVAIHILCGLPGFDSSELIAQHLNLEVSLVNDIISFLISIRLVEMRKNRLHIGKGRIHLPKGSFLLPRHHSNWRMKAIESLDRQRADDLHYSALLGIAQKDKAVFRKKILELIEEFEVILDGSSEEIPVVFLCDLFSLES